MKRDQLVHLLNHINEHNFEEVALSLFHYQYQQNNTYRQYINLIGKSANQVQSLDEIPFLPIELFKSHPIKSGATYKEEVVFSSSGTTGQSTSKHYVQDVALYDEISRKGFEGFYGDLSNWCVLALLPAYLERSGSSLVHMARHFIQLSKYEESGFFLNDFEKLSFILEKNQAQKIPTLLLGVSFALMDLAESFPQNLSNITIMETGGMKGRRKELTRSELHQALKAAFQVDAIHSEYGMTELLSQGYSKGNGIYQTIPSMKVLAKEINDPFTTQKTGKTGVLNIVDLANIDSCAFIATQDLGKCYEDGSFEVLGRLDYSMMRGCNLMVL